VPRTATYNPGERLSMFVLAAVVLFSAVGSAFAAGFVIGRILL
jgi:hypothetical protein